MNRMGLFILMALVIGCSQTETKTVKVEDQVKTAQAKQVQPRPANHGLMAIHFDFDKYRIKSSEKQDLNRNAAILVDNTHLGILVEGHCDKWGSAAYNDRLGLKRAASIKQYLIALGIDPGRIQTVSYGKSRPVNPANHRVAYAENRRGAFVVVTENYQNILAKHQGQKAVKIASRR